MLHDRGFLTASEYARRIRTSFIGESSRWEKGKNQPVRVEAVVPMAVDIRVRYLNCTVSDWLGVIAMSRYRIWSIWSG